VAATQPKITFSCSKTQYFEKSPDWMKQNIVTQQTGGYCRQLSQTQRVEHLDRYLGEFCWRYNRRHQQHQLFDMALKT
jgi:hypothetical protein